MISDSIGITYTDSKQIAMGQNFIDDLRPVISKAAKARHRVLVQAIYLTTSIGEISHAMGLDSDPKSLTGSDTAELVLSNGGILPDSQLDVIKWIVDVTEQWRKSK